MARQSTSLTINITQAIIDSSRKGASLDCPFAIALNEQYPASSYWRVYGYVIYNPNPGEGNYRHSLESREWLLDYDCGRDVEPGVFELPISKG